MRKLRNSAKPLVRSSLLCELELLGGSVENNGEHGSELSKEPQGPAHLFIPRVVCFWRHSLSRTSPLLHLKATEKAAGASNALSGKQ